MVRASCGGGVELRVEGGFKNGIREESPCIGDEAGGVGEGKRAGAVGAAAIEDEGEAAVV